jgi:phenylpropionate dioxygenase-like ring-hydroxylating dioxygenase large terminal subunit
MIMNVVSTIRAKLDDDKRGGLPSWVYTNPEFLEIEKQELFRNTWQIACHVSDVPNVGDYYSFDIVGERALILRGKDNVVRAFHNVCRHRGSRVVVEQKGTCKSAIVCPFHGWSYNLDGTLRAVPQAKSLPKLDAVEHGLTPIDFEIWHGFVFVRFISGDQPSVDYMMAPHEDIISHYRMDHAKPYGATIAQKMPVNWKSVRDVDNEGYHVPVAHPALQDLYGNGYIDENVGFGITRSKGVFNDSRDRYWSVRNYKKFLPAMEHLPEASRKTWYYYGLFPNMVLMLYPDLVGFYQEFPLGVDKTIQRFSYYALGDNRRETKVSRYLAKRIDELTGVEDSQLIAWSFEALQSSGYKGLILSDLESGVRVYHDMLRQIVPVVALAQPPANGAMAETNRILRSTIPPLPWGR